MDATKKPMEQDTRRAGAGFDPEPWRSELTSFARRCGAGHEADDLVQEVFVRALREPAPARPRPWLYRVLLHLLADRARRRAGRQTSVELPGRVVDPDAVDPQQSAEQRELVADVARRVARLPLSQRAALLLRTVRHLDYDEVALALDCSVATARQHFYLAVKTVRDALETRER